MTKPQPIRGLAGLFRDFDCPDGPWDRYRTIETLTSECYRRRRNGWPYAALCEWMAHYAMEVLDGISPDFMDHSNIGYFDSPATLCKLLEEQGRDREAIDVCRWAIRHNAREGTTSGYTGRLKRLERGGQWLGENRLYHGLRKALPFTVLRHKRFSWLEPQHLDIYIPKRRTAIECQGDQHYRPVAFFGGEDAFYLRQAYDERKATLCHAHRIRLLYVEPSDSVLSVVGLVGRVAGGSAPDFTAAASTCPAS
ncbi:MAG: hypothetical protein IID41_15950 [Planctomycetes bacterium]|nr:hypothetical protein [Planctomycetota bacterium]